MTLGAVAEIRVRNPAVLDLPVIHQIATVAMIERFRLELSSLHSSTFAGRDGNGSSLGHRVAVPGCRGNAAPIRGIS